MTETAATAALTEVFSSVQGEGPYLGVRQVFVRFYGCHRRCIFCDSPDTVTAWQPPGYQPPMFQLEQTPGRRDFLNIPNPLSIDRMVELIARLDQPRGVHHSVAFTGGEPLLQAPFLRDLLPRIEHLGLKTYLETAGDLYLELDRLLPWLDIAAMDIKLPSVTKNEAAWGGHRHFLARCVENEVEVFCKAIVSAETDLADLEEAFKLVAEVAPLTLFVLQPMTAVPGAASEPRPDQLLDWQRFGLQFLPHVRVIPQCHKLFGAL